MNTSRKVISLVAFILTILVVCWFGMWSGMVKVAASESKTETKSTLKAPNYVSAPTCTYPEYPDSYSIYGKMFDGETGRPMGPKVLFDDMQPYNIYPDDGSIWYFGWATGTRTSKLRIIDLFGNPLPAPYLESWYGPGGQVYWTAQDAPAISVGPGTCLKIDISVWKSGVLYGTIRDANGQLLQPGSLTLRTSTPITYGAPIVYYGNAPVTWDSNTGVYTATGIHPKLSYILSFYAPSFGQYYYDGATTAENATPITVGPSERRRLDIVVSQPVYNISGSVVNTTGQPVADVIISDGSGATARTAADGAYTFANVTPGLHTFTPSKAGYTFNPASLTANIPPNAIDQNFIAIPPPVITGRIVNVDKNFEPLAGVSVKASNNTETLTDPAGYYTLTNLSLAATYMITPSLPGYFFMPIAATVTLTQSHATRNFEANDRRPLIFIPGLVASTLVDRATNTELWTAFNDDVKNRLSLFTNVDPAKPTDIDVIATDAIRKVPVPFLPDEDVYGTLLEYLTGDLQYREYQVAGLPERRGKEGCDYAGQHSQHPKLFVFAYDWRLDNSVSAGLLRDYMLCIKQFYPDTPVNILTHSMGSLLARRYILDNAGTHNVAALITIAAPWLGAPKAINVLETGDMGFPSIIVPKSVLKQIAGSFKGAHQLLPGQAYYDLAGPFWGEDGWDADKDGNNKEWYTYADSVEFVNSRYGRDGFTPGSTGSDFHSYPSSTNAQDDWSIDNSGVQYYHIHGIQNRDDTIGKILMVVEEVPVGEELTTEEEKVRSIPTLGDGTVPLISAQRKNLEVDYNAPGAETYTIVGDFDHTTLTSYPTALNLISTFLAKERPSLTANLRENMIQASGYDSTQVLPNSRYANYLNIFGTKSFTVKDTAGNTILVSPSGVSESRVANSKPHWTFYILGEKTFEIITSLDTPYTITFDPNDPPVSVELIHGNSSETAKVIRYLTMRFPSNSKTELKMSTANELLLRYDSNGDGVVDTAREPTAIAAGELAADETDPEVTITSTQQGNQALVTITATDNASGVARIRYSTDGTLYQGYSVPFQVDLSQVKTISAFAYDGVGNRSVTVKYSPPQISSPKIFVSSNLNGQVLGVAYRDEDIIAYNPVSNIWEMVFDGSDVGVGNVDVDAFAFLPNGHLLLSFDSDFTLRGFGPVDDSDILEFTPTSLGNVTTGSFSRYFDGSDVGLDTSAEDIDGIDFTPDGKLLVSVTGKFKAGNLIANDEDILQFNAMQSGENTIGTWQLYFKGANVGLTTESEDVLDTWTASNGDIYLNTIGKFAVTGGLQGDGNDIFVCKPVGLSNSTGCNFTPYWDGTAHGMGTNLIDGFHIGDIFNPAITTLLDTSQGNELDDTVEFPGDDADDVNELDGNEESDGQNTFLPLIQR